MKHIYLDHSATTPVDPLVLEAMLPYWNKSFGNPSSVHRFGRDASFAIERARKTIANAINAQPHEIHFVGSGTEANNLAIKGVHYANNSRHQTILTTPIEHDAVRKTCEYLATKGAEIREVAVNSYGRVDLEKLQSAANSNTALISVIHGSNEIGTINDLEAIGQIAQQNEVYFHTDAVQTFGKIPIDVERMRISLLSASGHKINGPKGIGCLFIREGSNIDAQLHGGGQENHIRAGTQNVPAIVGFAKATELAMERMQKNSKRIERLRDYFQDELQSSSPDVKFNGDPENRLFNILNVTFPRLDSESILIYLDRHGIAASNGSACNSGSIEPSHVLQAIGHTYDQANCAIRFSLGNSTTEEEIKYVVKIIKQLLRRQ